MESKEKAKELVNLYMDLLPYSNNMISTAKKMAKIAVNEIIKTLSEFERVQIEYWNEVLKEIDERKRKKLY